MAGELIPITYLNSQDRVAIKTTTPQFNSSTFNSYLKLSKTAKAGPDDLAEMMPGDVDVEAIIMILDSNGLIKYITNKFVLNTFQMSMKEKFQLMESFGASNLSFFGEAARVYSFSGAALDWASSDEFNKSKYFHQSSLIKMYNDVLRGSQLIQNKRIAVMRVVNHLIYGYPINMSVSYSGASDNLAQFNLQWVVTSHTLNLPGVVEESDLSNLYATLISDATDKQTKDFISNADFLILKIDKALTAIRTLQMQIQPDSDTLNDTDTFIQDVLDVVTDEAYSSLSVLLNSSALSAYRDFSVSTYFSDSSIKTKVDQLVPIISKLKNDLLIFKSYRVL